LNIHRFVAIHEEHKMKLVRRFLKSVFPHYFVIINGTFNSWLFSTPRVERMCITSRQSQNFELPRMTASYVITVFMDIIYASPYEIRVTLSKG
jgi:hypothetical protein